MPSTKFVVNRSINTARLLFSTANKCCNQCFTWPVTVTFLRSGRLLASNVPLRSVTISRRLQQRQTRSLWWRRVHGAFNLTVTLRHQRMMLPSNVEYTSTNTLIYQINILRQSRDVISRKCPQNKRIHSNKCKAQRNLHKKSPQIPLHTA